MIKSWGGDSPEQDEEHALGWREYVVLRFRQRTELRERRNQEGVLLTLYLDNKRLHSSTQVHKCVHRWHEIILEIQIFNNLRTLVPSSVGLSHGSRGSARVSTNISLQFIHPISHVFTMISSLKKRVPNVLANPKTITYGLKNTPMLSRRLLEAQRLCHRQYTSNTFLTSNSLRRRYTTLSPANLRAIQSRPLSYSSIPRFVARAFRVPIAGATIGAGGLGYVNYKFEGVFLSLSLFLFNVEFYCRS